MKSDCISFDGFLYHCIKIACLCFRTEGENYYKGVFFYDNEEVDEFVRMTRNPDLRVS